MSKILESVETRTHLLKAFGLDGQVKSVFATMTLARIKVAAKINHSEAICINGQWFWRAQEQLAEYCGKQWEKLANKA